MPSGSRRHLIARGVLRQLMEAACVRSGRPLAEVLSQVERSRGAVIFPPSVAWNVKLLQRPHHLARTFARRGYVAIFASIALDDDVFGFREIEPNLFLFRGPARVLPIASRTRRSGRCRTTIMKGWPSPPRHRRLRLDRRPRDLHRFRPAARARQPRAGLGRSGRSGERRADAARAGPRAPERRRLPAQWRGGEERFDTTGAADPDDPTIARLRREGKPIAGYYGALARWFDYELLETTARRRPDWNFLLIGPDYDGSLRRAPALACPNVAWIGPRPYASLPAYLRVFDVATIPFRLGPITMATSPLKLYEYFAGGRPVVTTPLPECVAHPEVHVVWTADEFAPPSTAPDARAGSGLRARLWAVAAANSWRQRSSRSSGCSPRAGRAPSGILTSAGRRLA